MTEFIGNFKCTGKIVVIRKVVYTEFKSDTPSKRGLWQIKAEYCHVFYVAGSQLYFPASQML